MRIRPKSKRWFSSKETKPVVQVEKVREDQ